MRQNNIYDEYSSYIAHQKEKTTDPIRRKKWLSTEWELKLSGFKRIFSELLSEGTIAPGQRALCIGARTGQEVVALKEMGLDAEGVDLVECIPYVRECDMHDLSFYGDEQFDFVYSNVFDHSLYPKTKIKEIERVLKTGGIAMVQLQLETDLDIYTETEIDDVYHDVIALFKQSAVHKNRSIKRNFANMNYEVLMRKDGQFTKLHEEIGSVEDQVVAGENKNLWDKICLPVQEQKATIFDLRGEERAEILNSLSKRGTYLARLAKATNSKNIAEVGTAQGWQFYTFANMVKNCGGGHVWSCDIRDVRDSAAAEVYDSETTFIKGDEKVTRSMVADILSKGEKIDFFYVDGSHEKGHVMRDVMQLRRAQSEDCVWVFDDFDERFGAYEDIKYLLGFAKKYQIYSVGKTASNNPSHQVVIYGKI